jgi:general secretion pathway protein D
MVRQVVIVLFLLIATSAQADNVNLEFQSATISEVVQSLVKGVLNRDYSISPDVIEDDRRVSLSVRNKSPDDVLQLLNIFLNQHGLLVQDIGSILYVSKQPKDPGPSFQLNQLPDNLAASVPGQVVEPVEFITRTYNAKHRSLKGFSEFNKITTAAQYVSLDDDLAIVTGSKDQVLLLEQLLALYDRPVSELELKVSIVEHQSSSDSSRSFYASLGLLASRLNISIGNPSTLRDSLSLSGTNFSLVMSAIENDSNFQILDTTVLRVVSGKAGRINVGQEVPVLSQFVLDANNRQIQSVNYRASGLIVDIQPVLIDDQVHAKISQQLSSFAITSTSSIDSPTLLKREIETNLTSNLNEVVIIGGLEEVRKSQAKSTFFGLPIGKQENESKNSLFLVLEFQRR